MATHLLLIWALAVDLRVPYWPVRPVAEKSVRPPIDVQLVHPQAVKAKAGEAPAGSIAVSSRAASNKSAASAPPLTPITPADQSPAPEAPTAAAPPADGAPSDGVTDRRVTALLRGALGCNRTGLVTLSPEERAKCDEQMAGLASGRLAAAPLGLSPEAKAAFDLAVLENKSAHIPFAGCFARFGQGKIQWYHPSRGLKLPGLPCYFVAPKGVLQPDAPKAKGYF